MLSSTSHAFRGLIGFSNMARKSLLCSSLGVSQRFHTQSGEFHSSPAAWTSSDCRHQLTSVRHRSNRSRRGLYDGKDIRSGNNVSFSMRHTRRTFKPNVFKKRVYSEILDEMIQFHMTTSALRSIDKAGGLDNYLLKSRHVTDEGEGYAAKKRILKELKRRKRMEERMAAIAQEEFEEGIEEATEGAAKSRKEDE